MNLSPIEKLDMLFQLESLKLIRHGLGLALISRMTSFARVLAPLFIALTCSALTVAQASATAELRKVDIANRQKNIKIIYADPLKIKAGRALVNFKGLPHTVLNETQIVQLDQELRARNFANAFKNDGCYAKAHLISYELSRVGIKHSKILIYGDRLGDIKVFGEQAPILFEFHVSPLVFVRMNNGKLIPYVLDLSFFNKPVQLNNWLHLFYKDSNVNVLKNSVRGPENIDPTWAERKDNPYDVDLLYRFETEIEAFLLIVNNKARPR